MLAIYLSMLETEEERSKAERIYRRYKKLMKYIALQNPSGEKDKKPSDH